MDGISAAVPALPNHQMVPHRLLNHVGSNSTCCLTLLEDQIGAFCQRNHPTQQGIAQILILRAILSSKIRGEESHVESVFKHHG